MTFAQPFEGYEILARIGSGAMGTVFKARQKRLNRIVALKVLRPSLARNTHYVERLRREAQIVAQLNDPHIVAGYDLGEEAGYHFFVMEYVEGRSLRELLAEWGSFPEQLVVDFAIQVAGALDHAWRKGVIHRDIKPANILIDAQNRVKLTDMGLAKGPSDLTITRDGATVGTPQYISPEQARDPQAADIRSDLYSLGATMFHMATGVPPFQASTLAEVLTKVLHERPPNPREILPQLSEGLDLVIRKLLSKEPARRYQTPAELLADLERVGRSELPRVDVAALDETIPLPARRRWPYAAAGLLLLAAVGWALAGRGAPEPRPAERLAADLTAALQRAPDYAQKLEVLARAEAQHRAGELRDVVAAARGGVESAFLAELQRLLDGFERAADQRDELRDWLHGSAGWQDAGSLRARFLAPRIERHFGLRLDALPQRLASEVHRLAASAEQRLAPLVAERDRALLLSLREHHEREVPATYRPRLEARDFRGAAELLARSVREFFGRDGRPARADLAPRLAEQVDAIEQATLAAAATEIDAEERKFALALQDELRLSLTDLGERFAGDPVRRQQALVRLQRDLREQYPPAQFRPAGDPWPEAEATLRAAERSLEAELAQAELSRLEPLLRIATQALLFDGTPGLAAEYLREEALEGDEARARREATAALLADAQLAYERWLALAGGRLEARPSRGGAPLVLEVRVSDGVRRLVRTDGPPPAPHEIHWSSLFDPARARMLDGQSAEQQRRLDAGIAIWLLAGGESLLGLERLRHGAPERLAAAHQLERAIAALRPTGASPSSAAIVQLRQAVQRGDAPAIRAALAAIATDPAATAAHEELLAEAQRRLGQLEARQQRLTAIRAALPPGTALELGEDGAVALRYALLDPRLELPAGWERAAHALRFTTTDARAGGGLWLRDGLDAGAEAAVEIELRIPELREPAVLHLFELHGVGFALGALRDGRPVAAVFAPAQADRSDSLRRVLQAPLREACLAAPAITPGARHRLRLEVTRVRDRLRGRLWLDGKAIAAEAQLELPSRGEGGLRIQPLQPLELESIELRSAAPR